MGLARDIVQSVSLTIYHDHGELLVPKAMSLGHSRKRFYSGLFLRDIEFLAWNVITNGKTTAGKNNLHDGSLSPKISHDEEVFSVTRFKRTLLLCIKVQSVIAATGTKAIQ